MKKLVLGLLVSAIAACTSAGDVGTAPKTSVRIQILVPSGGVGAMGPKDIEQFSVAAVDANGSLTTLLSPVLWSTSDTTAARVDQTGLVKTVGPAVFYLRASVQTGNAILVDSILVPRYDAL